MKSLILTFLCFFVCVNFGLAQEENQELALSKEILAGSAHSVVKLVADSGRRTGAGVLLAVHRDSVGFILTTYSMVAGRENIAVLLKDQTRPFLGHIIDRWIDFDLDLAVIGVRKFPENQSPVKIGDSKKIIFEDTFTLIGHQPTKDWVSDTTKVINLDERYFAFEIDERSDLEGSPIVTKDGWMIGLVVSEQTETLEGNRLSLAIKSNVIKAIIKQWFESIALRQKWQEPKGGFPSWLWAVGGGVLGGTAATLIAIAGGGDGGSAAGKVGLPAPPDPPGR